MHKVASYRVGDRVRVNGLAGTVLRADGYARSDLDFMYVVQLNHGNIHVAQEHVVKSEGKN